MEENIIQPPQKESFKKPLIVLIVLFVLYGIVSYLQTKSVTWEDYQNIMSVTPGGDRMSKEVMQSSYDATQNYAFVSLFGGIARVISILFISLILYLGFNIASKRQVFNTIFKCVIYADVVILIQTIVMSLIMVHSHYDCYFQTQVVPLSVLSFLNVCNLEPYMIGILKYINIFEVMYFGVLSYFLVKSIPDQPKKQVIIIAACCYGIILILSMLRDTITLMGLEKMANM